MKAVLMFLLGLAWVGCGESGDDHPTYDGGISPYDGSIGASDSSIGPPEDATTDEDYEHVGTNPFVETGHDPFSTFAADVDTASYDIFVRDVEGGLLPDPASVRLEEYVNYFEYDYPAPALDSEVPFSISLAASTHAMGRQLVHLRIGIQASEPPEYVQLPSNIVFLVDTSGSMDHPQKLPLVQQLLRETLNVLTGADTVSIVTYSGTADVRLEPTPTSDRTRITSLIDSLSASGSTAGAPGIQLAYEQAEAGFIEGGFNHVILCTDGDFNVGISDTDGLVAFIEEQRRGGVTLTALGFGDDLNDAMMERVSNSGNGIYSVITSEEHATRYAAEDMLRTVHHVAKDMKIQVEFNPEHVHAYRLLGYENRAIADMDFRNDVVDAGEVGAGHRVTALYELVLTGQDIPAREGAPPPLTGEPVTGQREIEASDFVLVKVRWKDLGASETDPAHETSATLAPEDIAGMLSTAEPDLMWAAAIASFAEILKQSPYAEPADLDAIEAIVTPQASRDADRTRFGTLFSAAREMLGE